MRLRIGYPSLVFIAFVCVAAQAMELHVAASGADTNDGSASAPFATLERARDAIRTVKAGAAGSGAGSTVWVHAGTYALSSSCVLGAEDSGTPEGPILYRNVEGEEVRLIGGRLLMPESFTKVTDDAVLKRLDEAARASVVTVDLRALGIADLGEMPEHFENAPALPELFCDGARMVLARWPNEGWAEIAKVIESGPAPWRNYQSDKAGVFEYSGDRPSRWLLSPGVWLQGYWCFDWAIDSVKVGKIDPETRQITLGVQHHYGIGSGNPAPRRYFAFNLLEELDQPGEYYVDREQGKLYFWPPASLEGKRVVLTTLTQPMLEIKDASYLTLHGLVLETCAGTAIHVSGGSHVTVEACTIRNTGLDAINVEGGDHHTVVACDIYDTGTAGIRIEGGERKSLTSSGHEVVNNDIYNVSRRQRTHAYNLHVGGVGVHVAHNAIHDAPHQAIGVGGNDHLFEYNDIYRICMDSDDCGAFYMGRNPSDRGTVIRYNFWHDIGSKMSHGSCAIYFDDGDGGQKVIGNVFYHAAGGSFGAVFNHGGHDNYVENNVFVECKRAMGAAPWPDDLWKQWLGEPLWQDALLKQVDITKPPFTERYQELNGFMESWKLPRVNHATRNVVVRCESDIDGNWHVQDSLVLKVDPGFVDSKNQNFALRDDSMVYRVIPGFERIPFEQIGLFKDALRPTLPAAGQG